MTAPDRIWVDDDTWFSKPVTYPHAIEYLRADVVEARLSDPAAVHANMLRGTIAKPTVEQIIHLYGREAFQPMIDAAIAKALEGACLAVSEHADWPEDEHGRTEQVGLFARVINAIRAIKPAVTQPAPDPAAIREAAQPSPQEVVNVLKDAAAVAMKAREAALREAAEVAECDGCDHTATLILALIQKEPEK